MRNIWIVVRHDVGVTLRQRSFWVIALLVGLIVLVGYSVAIIAPDSAHLRNPLVAFLFPPAVVFGVIH